MNILSLYESLRKERLVRSQYNSSTPYTVNVSEIVNLSNELTGYVGNIFTSLSVNSLVNLFTINNQLTQIAQERLLAALKFRVSQEVLDEIIPVDINFKALFGDSTLPFIIRRDDYAITKQSVFQRLTGVNLFNRTFLDANDLNNVSKERVQSKIIENTGRIQTGIYEQNINLNLYSGRLQLTLEKKNQIPAYDSSVNYWLENRLVNEGNYFSDLIYISSKASDHISNQIKADTIDKGAESGIGATLTTALSNTQFTIDGEYGEVKKVDDNREGNCGEAYLPDDVQSLNDQKINNDDNPSKRIIWGESDVEDFGAKRGLLYYTSKAITNTEFGSQHSQTKKCFDFNQKLIYKGVPCRSWTVQEYYGQNKESLIRFQGNGVKNSVIKDYVKPKIHPVINRDPEGLKRVDNSNLFFSLENLAYTKEDLLDNNIPECEWGDNYGRLMWFPPYIESFSESANANYQATNFVGRPEPLYTYVNSTRSASLTFHIIVDYPSYIDNLDIQDKHKFFNCDPSLITTALDNQPDFKITFDSEFDVEIDVPPLDVPTVDIEEPDTPTEELDYGDVYFGDFYFENDNYDTGFPYEFEVNEPANGASPSINNSYGLNIPFYGEGSGGNFTTGNGAYGRVIDFLQEDIEGIEKPIKLNTIYRLEITGRASELYNASNPNLYNVYLSLRRSLDMAARILTNAGITPSSMVLKKEGSGNFFKQNSGEDLEGLPFLTFYNQFINSRTTRSIKDNPPYVFAKGNKMVFENSKGFELQIGVEGSPQIISPTGEQSQQYWLEEEKRKRKVDIYAEVLPEKLNLLNEQIGELREEESVPDNQEEITLDSDSNIETEVVLTANQNSINRGNNDNCYGRYEQTDPVYMKENNVDFVKDRYGFKGGDRKYAPTFHSQTPEDYHRRRTFLQQVLRPGNSKADNNAKNSVFGRPPICVLRLGDFFHTKIVIDSISFTEEMIWDFNPEGMGAQFMVTKVSMNFNVIGGQSLESHIERIQNANSFNYYANSTFYGNTGEPSIYGKAKDVEEEQININKKRTSDMSEEQNLFENN